MAASGNNSKSFLALFVCLSRFIFLTGIILLQPKQVSLTRNTDFLIKMLSFFGIFFPCLFPSGSWAINILDLMIDCFVMKIASGLVPRRQPFKKYRCYSLDSPWPSLSSDPGHPCHRRLAAGQHPPAPVDVGLLLGQHPPAPVEVEGWAGCAETWLFTQKSCGQEGTVNLKMKAGSAHSVFLLILTTPQMSSGRDRVCRVSGTINEQNVQLFPS